MKNGDKIMQSVKLCNGQNYAIKHAKCKFMQGVKLCKVQHHSAFVFGTSASSCLKMQLISTDIYFQNLPDSKGQIKRKA